MTPIGGCNTASFTLSPESLSRLEQRVLEEELAAPGSVVRHRRSGGLTRFLSADEALVAKMAIV